MIRQEAKQGARAALEGCSAAQDKQRTAANQEVAQDVCQTSDTWASGWPLAVVDEVGMVGEGTATAWPRHRRTLATTFNSISFSPQVGLVAGVRFLSRSFLAH